jgi:hypothetical protein
MGSYESLYEESHKQQMVASDHSSEDATIGR